MVAPASKTVTHKRILSIALPIVISNATVPLVGIVDTGVVGQLGAAAPIGAVGLGAIVLTALYWIFGFLRMGTVGLTGQALGDGDAEEVAALLTRVLIIALVSGAGLILLQGPIFWAALAWSDASAEVEQLMGDYLRIRIWSAPAAIAIYGITGWLIAQERTRAVLGMQLVMNGLNVGLDLLFVLHLGWGVQGVAIATVIAEVSGALVGLWFCRKAFADPLWRAWARVFDRVRLLNMARVNSDILIRSVMVQAIFVSFLVWGADFGDVDLAANQILLQFLYLTSYAMDGFAFAAEALVAQAMGARNKALLRRGAVLITAWSAGLCLVLGLSFFLFGPWVIDTMTTSQEVRAAARVYLIYMVLAPIAAIFAWMLDGIFIGATQSRDMRNMMILSAAVYFVAAALLVPSLENHGLWICLLLSFVVRGVTLALKYPRIEARAQA